MEHKDAIILTKVMSEISIAQAMLGKSSYTEFEENRYLFLPTPLKRIVIFKRDIFPYFFP